MQFYLFVPTYFMTVYEHNFSSIAYVRCVINMHCSDVDADDNNNNNDDDDDDANNFVSINWFKCIAAKQTDTIWIFLWLHNIFFCVNSQQAAHNDCFLFTSNNNSEKLIMLWLRNVQYEKPKSLEIFNCHGFCNENPVKQRTKWKQKSFWMKKINIYNVVLKSRLCYIHTYTNIFDYVTLSMAFR